MIFNILIKSIWPFRHKIFFFILVLLLFLGVSSESDVSPLRPVAQPHEKTLDSSGTEDNSALHPDSINKVHDQDEKISAERESIYQEGMKILNRTYSPSLEVAYSLLLKAAEMGHEKAREEIAMMSLFGFVAPHSITSAHHSFTVLAKEGNPRGQLGLGLMHAIGLGLNASIPHALVYLTFSALGGDPLAEMALGYRYWVGLSVESNCETSLTYYHRVAKKVATLVRERAQTGGPTLMGPTVHRVRLADESEASFSFFGGDSGSTYFISDDLLQYYQFMADKNNVTAQVFLGQLYYHGHHGVEMDHKRAFDYFKKAAGGGSYLAMAFLGEMLIVGGEDIQMDAGRGVAYLRFSAEANNPVGQTLLGIAYMRGRADLLPDAMKALELFLKAADQGLAEAQLHLGLLFLGTFGIKADYKLALKYLNLASQQGNVLALYHLAEMHASGVGVIRSCQTATEFFKNVAERGRWSQLMMYALASFRDGRYDEAYLVYQVLGELGYEVAQTNAAYLLEEGKITIVPSSEIHRRAFVQLQRSANQGSTVSRVRLGDYYYYGLGVEKDFAMAIQQYRIASDIQRNSQAMFNLAYMHEQGQGFKRDIHLAKRFYDMSAETSKDAQIPVALALMHLQFYLWLETFNDAIQSFVSIFNPSNSVIDGSTIHTSKLDWDFYLIPLLIGLLLILIFFIKCRQMHAVA